MAFKSGSTDFYSYLYPIFSSTPAVLNSLHFLVLVLHPTSCILLLKVFFFSSYTIRAIVTQDSWQVCNSNRHFNSNQLILHLCKENSIYSVRIIVTYGSITSLESRFVQLKDTKFSTYIHVTQIAARCFIAYVPFYGRQHSLEQSHPAFPRSFILVNSIDGCERVIGHARICRIPSDESSCWIESGSQIVLH